MQPVRAESADRKNGKIVRVWMDGCFDLFHCGHANALRQAKQLGDYLVAGIHSDKSIAENKALPVYTEEERYRLISAIKWVDEIVKDSPFSPDLNILNEYNCDFAVHGDDTSVNADGECAYQKLSNAKRFRIVKRTQGISTTDLVGRMLIATKGHHNKKSLKPLEASKIKMSDSEPEVSTSPFTGSSPFLPSTKLIAQFADHRDPKPHDKVVYVLGSFDLFHIGHLAFLEKAKQEADYLLVGIHTDAVSNQYKGDSYPIMNLHERVLTVLSIKYVDEVLIGAPYVVSADLIDHWKVDKVLHGNTPIACAEDGSDPFAIPKARGIFKVIDSGCDLRSETVINRIIANRLTFEERNRKKQEKELNYINNT